MPEPSVEGGPGPVETVGSARSEESVGSGRRWRALFSWRRDRAHRAPADRFLFLVTFCLVGLGIVMIYSASAIRAQDRFGDPAFFLKRQLVYACLGLVVMAWAAGRELKTLQRLTPILFLASVLLLLLVLIPHIGIRINGARTWIRLFSVS